MSNRLYSRRQKHSPRPPLLHTLIGILGLICLLLLLPLLHVLDWQRRTRRQRQWLEAQRMRLIMRAQLRKAPRR